MEVFGAAQVFVLRADGGLRGRQGQGIETVGQDRLDAAVAHRVDRQGPLAGGFKAGFAVALAKAQDAQAGAVALFGVAAALRGEVYRPPEYLEYLEKAAAALKTVRMIVYAGMTSFVILAVVCRPRRSTFGWQATRCPWWNISTVFAVWRTSSLRPTKAWGTE